ncbi:MAG: hypothetical protein ACO3TQ_07800, partial [Burkholderiaceae bacterium]
LQCEPKAILVTGDKLLLEKPLEGRLICSPTEFRDRFSTKGIKGPVIHLREARPIDSDYASSLEGALSEWETRADEDAYRKL